jgi:hypothetical protein
MFECNLSQSQCQCSEEIYPEIFVVIALRYPADGSYDDIREVYGVSVPGFYYCINQFFKAVLNCDALKIHLPDSPDTWEEIRVKFHCKSKEGIIRGCVGAIDSFFQPTKCPTVRERNGNVCAYYSGHCKNCYVLK